MKIACLVKYAFDPASLVVDRNKGTIDFERSPKKISEADANAVEEAVRIKEKSKNSTVQIFSYGPSEALKPLKELVAMEADRAYLISDKSYSCRDSFTTASILYEAIRKFGPFDLVIAGHASEDNYSGAVALMVAEMLSVPHVAYATKLIVSPSNDSVIVERSVDGKVEVLKV